MRAALGALALLALVDVPAPAAAQQGFLFVYQPAEWRDGNRLTIAPGRTILLSAAAGHPAGVLRVLVNGEEVQLRPDPDEPGMFRFEKVVTATDTLREVTITIVPRAAEEVVRRYAVDTGPRQRQVVDPPPPAVQTPTVQQGAGEVPLRSPWGGFRTRGLGYGAAAIGGSVLMTMKKTEDSKVCGQRPGGYDCVIRTEQSPAYFPIGAALVGAAVVGTIWDAMMTSKKAKASSAGRSGQDETAAANLAAPAIQLTPTRVQLDLIRLRF